MQATNTRGIQNQQIQYTSPQQIQHEYRIYKLNVQHFQIMSQLLMKPSLMLLNYSAEMIQQ